MTKHIHLLFCICLLAATAIGCSREKNYETSPSVMITQRVSDSIVISDTKLAEKMLNEARDKAQDSTEYYYAETIRSSLHLMTFKLDSSLYYIKRVENYCARLPRLSSIHYRMLIFTENNRANIYNITSKPDSAIIAIQKSIEYCHLGRLLNRFTMVYINLGDMYGAMNDFPMQAYCYRRGLFTCDSLNLSDEKKYPHYFALGYSYMQMRNFKQSEEYLDKAYRQFHKMPLLHQFTLLNDYVNLHYYQKDYLRSWEYLMKTFELVGDRNDEMPFECALMKGNYADLSIKLGKDLKKAKAYLEETKQFFENAENAAAVYYMETLQLSLALKEGDMQTAKRLAQHFEENKASNIPANYLQGRNEALIEYYQRVSEFRKAFALLQANTQIDDSLRNNAHKNYVADLNMRYMNDTTHLKNRVTISNQQNKIKVLRLEMILAVGIVIGLAAWFIDYRRKIKKNRQRLFERHLDEISKLKMQNIREKISPHFTFNVLNREINLHPTSTTEHQRLMQLTKLLRKGLDLSNRLAIPLSEELDFVSTYVSLLQGTGNPFTFRLRQEGEIRTEDIKVPSMIIQIPVENAIKHGFQEIEGEAVIDLLLKDVQTGIEITIRNNGRKYTPFTTTNHPNSTGTGLKVIFQSITLMNTRNKEQITFNIRQGEEEEGTVVAIYIPYQYAYDW